LPATPLCEIGTSSVLQLSPLDQQWSLPSNEGAVRNLFE
jgi:hypothetical protein